MSNRKSNFPEAVASRSLDGTEFVSDSVSCIMELAKEGKPQSVEELRQRIHDYFAFCQDNRFRPGIESLSLALGTNRVQFWRWCGDDAKDTEWRDVCRVARQSIIVFTESAMTSGHLSPPVGIFLLKNVADYRDTLSFEDVNPTSERDEKTKEVIYPILIDHKTE